MAYDYERNVRSGTASAEIDLGLKAYMNKVYTFMAVGLALTGVIAHLTSSLAFDFSTNTYTAFGAAIYASPLAFIIMLSPLAFIIALNVGIAKMKESTVQVLFWAFAAVIAETNLRFHIRINGRRLHNRGCLRYRWQDERRRNPRALRRPVPHGHLRQPRHTHGATRHAAV